MDKKVITAAEYLGLENDILEAKRKELYGEA
jgi:predicted metallo-beta-lactamase superfamily hydrolase